MARLNNTDLPFATVGSACDCILFSLCRFGSMPLCYHMFIIEEPVVQFNLQENNNTDAMAGGAVPALAQLASSSYHAVVSPSSLPPTCQDEKMHKSRTSSIL
ncbi:hypothetical protein C1H46_042476 [Malus baccata]|uniref:Uncharacterized protein n=1 Tax=Malus baccata TaxID=106549 RepID=A0A540KD03_MALBA|nr:hypothetical protein C1H46_042476 [Malus baccata]